MESFIEIHVSRGPGDTFMVSAVGDSLEFLRSHQGMTEGEVVEKIGRVVTRTVADLLGFALNDERGRKRSVDIKVKLSGAIL